MPRAARRLRPLVALAGAGLLLVACSSGAAPPASSGAASGAAGPAPCSASTSITAFSDALDKTTVGGQRVGNLSGLAALPGGDVLALSDRSVLFTLDPTATRPLAATVLVDPAGGALDAESVVLDADGTRLVGDETGPQILRYAADGRLVGTVPVPPVLATAPAGRGRDNATLEGLALQPGGRTLVASLEEPLLGDDPGLTRLVTWTRPAPAAPFVPDAQYALPLPAGLGVSELTPTGDGRLLLLERGYERASGNVVHLVLADPGAATDVRAVDRLSPTGVPVPVPTVLLADLGACPPLGATARQPQRNPLLDNIEGMTVTGRAADGALELLLVSDDNDAPAQITRTYRLRLTVPAT